MAKRFFETNKGIRGGMLKGKAHYDSEGNSLGGIKAVVTDQGGTPVELEGNEVIINKKTVQSDKVLTVKGTPKEILSTLNQMDGNGVAIGDEEAEILAKYRTGGSIPKEIIMYHGSKNKFDKFNMINNTLRGIELGSHFGTYEQAKSFMSERYGENDKFYIYKCKLNLENTLKVDDIGWWTADNIYRFILKNKRYKLDFNDIDISTPENILKILKEKNIDSFKYSNLHEAEGDSYLVFDSSKIEILDTEIFRNGGELIKRADGSYSRRGLWDNIRDNVGSGRKPTKQMLEQEAKIKSKYHLGGDMSKHLAPNGKPSNLNHEQWHLVRTPEFKAWFGDWENNPENSSKVVDENGEPLVVYHGTNKDFNVFKKADKFREDWGVKDYGMYFSSSILTAKEYSFESIDENKEYLEWNNKLDELKKQQDWENWAKLYEYGKDKFKRNNLPINRKSIRIIECFLNIKNPFLINGKGRNWFIALKGSIDNAIKNKKDGMIASNIIEVFNEVQDTYVAFEPNQIKLADGTNTTFDENNDDIRFAEGGEIPSLIEKGVVDLKFHETTPEHAEIYGLTAEKPLYIQTLYVNDNKRLKGIGTKVLHYIYSIAKQNGNDVIFGHINQKASFTKDEKETTFNDIDMVKNWLQKNGYAVNEDNNDFHKVVKFKNGGSIGDMTPSEIKAFYDTPEGKKLDAETYAEWKSLVNMSKSEITNFYNSPEGKQAGLSESEANKQGIDSGRESARWIMKMKDIPYKLWTSNMWRWAKKQISFIKRMSGMKGELYDDKGRKTRKHTALLIWGHKPTKKFEGGGVPKDAFTKSENERNEDYEANWNLWIDTLLKNIDLPIEWTTSESRKELYGDSFYITIFNEDWQEFAKLRFSGHSVMNTSRLQNEFHNPNISRFYEIVSRTMNLKQQEKYPENSIKFEGGGELSKGTAHEMEHLATLKKVAEGKITPEEGVVETASKHLEENKNYYEDLAKMEKENKFQPFVHGFEYQILDSGIEGSDKIVYAINVYYKGKIQFGYAYMYDSPEQALNSMLKRISKISISNKYFQVRNRWRLMITNNGIQGFKDFDYEGDLKNYRDDLEDLIEYAKTKITNKPFVIESKGFDFVNKSMAERKKLIKQMEADLEERDKKLSSESEEESIPDLIEGLEKMEAENEEIKFAFNYSEKELEKHITNSDLDNFVKNAKFNSTAMAYNYPIPRRSGENWHLYISIQKPSRMGSLHNKYWAYLSKNTDEGDDVKLLQKSFDTLKEAKRFVGLNYYFETQRIYDVLEMEKQAEQEVVEEESIPELIEGLKVLAESLEGAEKKEIEETIEGLEILLESDNKYHLGGDMSKHLAPNGKPSNLNHEQWHLVRTSEFKAWFGDWENDPENSSKVIDENGEPLVVYHGTTQKFNSFDKEKQNLATGFGDFGAGFYFTSSFNTARYYTLKSEKDRIIMNVFLNIKKPFIVELNWEKLSDESIYNYKKIKGLQGYQRDIINDSFKEDRPSKYITKNIGDFIFQDILIVNGYDGVFVNRINIHKEKNVNQEDEILYLHEIVAFEPNQIKLADGTNTTFDGNNPDIRFAEGGSIGSVLWATKIGEPDYNEQIITENSSQIENAKKWALANGFDRLRVSTIDNSKPDFTKGFKKYAEGGEFRMATGGKIVFKPITTPL